jgi:hypothetical protein
MLRCRFTTTVADRQIAGLVLRESSTSKLHTWYIQNSGALQHVKYNSDTSFNSVGVFNQVMVGDLGSQWHWLRITDNGTNLLFSYSIDGVNFAQMGSEGRTSFMAGGPNQYGIMANVDSSAAAFDASFAHWLQT